MWYLSPALTENYYACTHTDTHTHACMHTHTHIHIRTMGLKKGFWKSERFSLFQGRFKRTFNSTTPPPLQHNNRVLISELYKQRHGELHCCPLTCSLTQGGESHEEVACLPAGHTQPPLPRWPHNATLFSAPASLLLALGHLPCLRVSLDCFRGFLGTHRIKQCMRLIFFLPFFFLSVLHCPLQEICFNIYIFLF